MKIELEGTLLKMTPENDREKTELNQLWTIIIDCVKENKKLVKESGKCAYCGCCNDLC